jgi:hypothetical protein
MYKHTCRRKDVAGGADGPWLYLAIGMWVEGGVGGSGGVECGEGMMKGGMLDSHTTLDK